MALKYNAQLVEEELEQFRTQNPNSTQAAIEAQRNRLIAREIVIKLWVDTQKRVGEDRSAEAIRAYEESIRKKPTREMAKAIRFVQDLEEPRRTPILDAVQKMASKAQNFDYLEKSFANTYATVLASGTVKSVRNLDGLGDAYFKGLFAAKTDPSGMMFDGIRETRLLTIEQLRQIQKKTDEIVIQPNEAASEGLIPYIVMGKFFTRENLEGMKAHLFGTGSTTPVGFDTVIAAKSNFFENTIINDERMNMHAVRSFAPAARSAAKDIVDAKNTDAIKESLSSCFRNLYSQAIGSYSITYAAWNYSVHKINDFLDEIKKSGIDTKDLGITKEQLRNVEALNAVRDLQEQHASLKKELYQAADEFIVSGHDKSKSPFTNPELNAKLLDEYVLRRAISRISVSIQGVSSSTELSGPVVSERLRNDRDLTQDELEYFYDPQGYLNKVREEVVGLEGYKDYLALEPTDNAAVSRLADGISSNHADNLSAKFSLDKFVADVLQHTVQRTQQMVKGLPIENEIGTLLKEMTDAAAEISKPCCSTGDQQKFADIFRKFNNAIDRYAETLSPKQYAEEKNAVVVQLSGQFSSAASSLNAQLETLKETSLKSAEKSKLAEDSLISEIVSLKDALIATEGNWTSNSPEYDEFSGAVKALPERLEQLKSSETGLTNAEALNIMQDASSWAQSYLDSHESLKDPSSRQVQRMALARQLQAINKRIENRIVNQYEAQEMNDARAWFDGLKLTLEQQGVNIHDPYALSRVCILHEIDFDEGIYSLNDPNSIDKALTDLEKMQSYAFMKQSPDGTYDIPRPEGKADINWLRANMQKPASLSDDDIMRLYRSAKDCRLILREPELGSELRTSPRYLLVNRDGKAACTAQASDFFEGMGDKPDTDYREYGMTEDMLSRLKTMEALRYNVNHARANVLSDVMDVIARSDRKNIRRFNDKHEFARIEKDMCIIACKYPEWFKTEEQRQLQYESNLVACITPIYRTQEENDLIQSNIAISAAFSYICKTFIKRFGTDDLYTLMESGKILKADKTPFSTSDIDAFARGVTAAATTGQGVFMEYEKNGKTISGIFVAQNDIGLVKAVVAQKYDIRLKQIREALAEVRKTDNSPELASIAKIIDDDIANAKQYSDAGYLYMDDGSFSSDRRNILPHCEKYINSLPKDASLTDSQIRTLRTMADIMVYGNTAQNVEFDPSVDTIDRIAAAMTCNKAAMLLASDEDKDVELGRTLLTNEEARNKAAAELKNSSEFKSLIEGKTPEQLEEIRVVQSQVPVEFAAAKQWFNQLLPLLEQQGVSLDNPLSADLVQIRNDVDEDLISNQPNTIEGKKASLAAAMSNQQPAFIKMDLQGKTETAWDPSQNRWEWMKKNTVTKDNISPEQITYLYKMAQQNRLFLKDKNPDTDRFQRNMYIKVASDGKPVIAEPIIKIRKDLESGGEKYKKYGFEKDEFLELNRLDAVNGSQEEEIATIYFGSMQAYDIEIGTAEAMQDEETKRRLENEKAEFVKNYSQYIASREVSTDASLHPYWYKDQAGEDLHTKAYMVAKIHPSDRTEEDIAFITENPKADRTVRYIEDSLLKLTGTKNLTELMNSQKTKTSEGKVITGKDEYEYLKNLYKYCMEGKANLIVNDKPYVYDPSGLGFDEDNELRHARIFAKELKEMLMPKGYARTMTQALVCVRNDDVDVRQFMNLGNSPEDIKKAYELIESAQQMAFIPRDIDGNILDPRLEGESRMDWIKRTSRSIDTISDDQKIWLYRAAKEGKLIINSDSLSAENEGPQYILAGENHKPVIGKNLAEMDKDPQAYGLTKEKIEALREKENSNNAVVSGRGMILVDGRMSISNKINNAQTEEEKAAAVQELSKFEKVEKDCIEQTYLHSIIAMNHSHRTWFDNPEDEKIVNTVLSIQFKNQDQLTDEEKQISVDYPAISEAGNTLEQSLIKITGQKFIAGIRRNNMVCDREGKPLSAETDFRFINELVKRADMKAEEIYVNGKPYRFLAGVGLASGIDKPGYEAEVKYVSDLFSKAGFKASEPEYEYLSQLMNELPEKVKSISIQDGNPKVELQSMLIQAATVGNSYISTIPANAKLSGAQLKCIKAINRLNDLKDMALNGSSHPDKGSEYKLAEKIATAFAIKNIKNPASREYMLNPSKRSAVISSIKEQPAFKKIFNECKAAGLDKAMRISGDKLCSSYEKQFKQIAKEAGQPQGPAIV